MLTTLTVVSVLMSFMIFTITQNNNNSELVIKKILNRLDDINNSTVTEQQYIIHVQAATLAKIFSLVNKSAATN